MDHSLQNWHCNQINQETKKELKYHKETAGQKSHFVSVKHEYLRSCDYIRLSLSSPFSSSSPVTVTQIWPLSRYSCSYLGSLHPRNFEHLRRRHSQNPKKKNLNVVFRKSEYNSNIDVDDEILLHVIKTLLISHFKL